ncbi:BTB/POZ domain-containing adapter for CUL3-mediated RhoA degradation protein 3-like [Anneissia japonica]|uniref:BTB/POZ domain-containing adapter for CUL3-mediated RhoA degradation protein 3-like n=1 Tax=Anneissia japonica TaxID=1529436 RepID=UPI0014254B1B|nr:BTB/POZ domain-containing adapter for CUL3-mediated RhoA degradation protein 3-like [Anneissia japonica]
MSAETVPMANCTSATGSTISLPLAATTSGGHSSSGSPATSRRVKGAPSKYVKLNVGGSLHYTTIDTLTKEDNMLRAMFSGRMEVLTDSEGWILIDRSGKHFGVILNYLRDGQAPMPESTREIEELLCEAKYYLVQGLVENCLRTLRRRKDEYEPVCRVPVVTSPREAQKLITSSCKPIVKLLYNRQNNKYSYTSNSDDNILKNIEMFDKLSLRFNGRVLFVKDVTGRSEEICCWTFYGHNKKVAEISCTSIVYTSERKQTKVEFPEARILEETLNILLYERWDGNDGYELSRSASKHAHTAHYLSDEDDEYYRLRKT